MNKRNMWVVVADAARARFFRLAMPEKQLEPIWEQEMIGVHAQSRDIGSDRPGRTFDSAGMGRHAKEPPTDPARFEKDRFAHDVAAKLDEERKANAFDSVVLVAPPQFLGDLRAHLSAPLATLVAAEVNKDLSKLKPAEIVGHLDEVIW